MQNRANSINDSTSSELNNSTNEGSQATIDIATTSNPISINQNSPGRLRLIKEILQRSFFIRIDITDFFFIKIT